MKNILIIILCISAASCRTHSQVVDVIEVRDYGQFYDESNGSVFTLGDTKAIAFRKNERLYISTMIYLTTTDITDAQGKKVDERVSVRDSSYFFDALADGAKYGLRYSSAEPASKPVLFRADTLLKSLNINPENFAMFSMDVKNPQRIVVDKHTVLEKSLFIKGRDSDPDSVLRFYDKRLNDVDFSLSPKLDSLPDGKLVKVVIIYNATVLPNGKKKPKMIMETSLSRKSDRDPKLIKQVFERFDKDQKTYPLQ